MSCSSGGLILLLSDDRSVLRRDRSANHELLELADDESRVEALRTHGHAVDDRVASEERVLVLELGETLFGELVSRVDDPATSIETISIQIIGLY